MAQVCVDPQGLVLVHSDGTLAHEDCPCGGGGNCCQHGGYCSFPTPPALATWRVRFVGTYRDRILNNFSQYQNTTIPFDAFRDFSQTSNCDLLGTMPGQNLGFHPVLGRQIFWDADPIIRYSSVNQPFASQGTQQVRAGAQNVVTPGQGTTVNFSGVWGIGVSMWYSPHMGGHGFTALAVNLTGGYTATGSAAAPTAMSQTGQCPVKAGGSGTITIRRPVQEPEYFVTLEVTEMSIELLNAGGCGGESAPGLDPPPGVELPPGWRWTENGPVPNLGCGGCGG